MQPALYRKYRPQSFDEIKGQDHIVSVLENEAETGKINHAYLFSGSKGTGKTTMARIFARSIGVGNDDIYEIDAASHRRIEEIREIRDAVHAYPYSSKYKVYILDEVHMLTNEAWNAFLKTLEEPPSHVIFIMATTEPGKLPDTVISRCETFSFKKPSHSILTEAILKVAREEKYEIERKSANLIATLASGSFRDAYSILQKAISSFSPTDLSAKASASVEASVKGSGKLSHEKIEEILGAPKESLVVEILEGLAAGDAAKSIGAVRQASAENADMQVFLQMILRSLRFILLLRFSPDLKQMIVDETGEEEYERLSALAKTAKNINSKTLLLFLEALSREPYSSIPELPIELAIIDGCGGEAKN